jgi:conserved hypothetical protein, phage tail-like region
MSGAACGCCKCLAGSGGSVATFNRPGLSRIARRIGTHATFFDAMIARLSTPLDALLGNAPPGRYSLASLTTRESDDPAIALLDAWAVVADVLTFYQERIANEGYLLTATEMRSLIELGRLIGYKRRPGVAASAYLAYTIDENGKSLIPAGAQVQSIPGPDETPQTFETIEAIEARGDWNTFVPRMTRPQTLADMRNDLVVWLKGTTTGVKPGDWLLFVSQSNREPHLVREVLLDQKADRTRVTLKPTTATPRPRATTSSVIESLQLRTSTTPRSALAMPRTLKSAFDAKSDNLSIALTEFFPILGANLWSALAHLPSAVSQEAKVYVMRSHHAVFGYNAPPVVPSVNSHNVVVFAALAFNEHNDAVYLDTANEAILPDSYILTQAGSAPPVPHQVMAATTTSRTDYGLSMKTTMLTLHDTFWTANADFTTIRTTTVYAQSEELVLAEVPIDDAIGTKPRAQQDPTQFSELSRGQGNQPGDATEASKIELTGFWQGLRSGRLVIVRGERVDVPGVTVAELAMIASVEQITGSEDGARSYNVIHLANALAYYYKRDTVVIYANVVKANHGKTAREILGAGDSGASMQSFTLHQTPLTWIAASTPSGVASTLQVRVNNLLWQETDLMALLGPADRAYVTTSDENGKVTITFGTGKHGARPPSGANNIRAVYRNEMGSAGNLNAGQLATAVTRPLGVKEVTNPLPATGGADAEKLAAMRGNAPLAVQALDRLVSVRDYEDFARTFAGIGKASAVRLTNGRSQIVHLTIAGQDDIAIDETSDLYAALVEALLRYGDPYQPLRVALREVKLIAGSARMRIDHAYLWENVAAAIRDALQIKFGFDARALGQPLFPSEVIAAIQAVPGVDYADLDTLSAFTADDVTKTSIAVAGIDNVVDAQLAQYDKSGSLHSAQLVYLSSKLTDAFILTEITQ